MEQFAKERDRLLQSAARAIGLGALAVSLVSLAVPGVIEPSSLLPLLPLYAVLAVALVRIGVSQSLIWVGLGLISGTGILILAQQPLGTATTPEIATALVPLAGGGMAAFGIVLVGAVHRVLVMAAGLVVSTVLIGLAVPGPGVVSTQAATVLLGWVLATTLGSWVSAALPRAARRIFSIGRAHRAERQASETEAQRRQGARLLHDTVLATLTLLAHSGVGVSPAALQQQAADDARLLRQLRLGGGPVPQPTGAAAVEPVEESALGRTLESVKQRFGRIGLEVSWHGTGQVLLPSEVLDAFLLALAECLENVRRHSGVTDAHVTITDDDTTVRAMVTDAGVGFSLDDIDSARLGFKDSVVGRLREVGGNARLFSSPGAGTTVVLEVPR
ncbi:sensor histidine kinase [Marisediminicola senii]|uniref:sensor histidine kinase n=1 Tax=Marisediminicola senii TaxID=2711233 RepID=UPI0013ECBD6E|nr:ATP-binding protein [Marisediminicola senii]